MTDIVFPLESLSDMNVDIYLLDIEHPGDKQTIYLLHNLWGYDINLSIVDANEDLLMEFVSVSNIDYETYAQPEDFLDLEILPDSMLYSGNPYVKCPTIHTLITMEEMVEPMCEELGGTLLTINERLQKIVVGDFTFADAVPPIRFVFHNLKVLPMDFIQTPQMYIASWRVTRKSALMSAGTVMTIVSIVVIAVVNVWYFYLDSLVFFGSMR